MQKKMKTRRTDIKVSIDYGEYLVGFRYQVTIGNSLLSTDIKYFTKPTKKQIRQLKKAWFNEMRNPDIQAIFYRKYSIKQGKYIDIKK